MKRLSLILLLLSLAAVQCVHAQYYSVNIDARTVAAMAAAFGTETVAESYYREQVDDILKHYTAAEVAAAGIFSSKFLERKALSELGIWSSSTENYYYRRIYNMVARKIIPKTWVVAKMMLRSPQTALYWGSYLMKVCDDTKSLCMQFESIVTNSTLTFSDVAFLEIKEEIAPLLKLSELGNIDWQRMLDDLARIPDNFTKENLQNDLDNLYNMGVGLATAGIGNIGDALLQTSSFHDLLNGKVEEIFNLYDHYSHLYEAAEQDAGRLLLDMVGGPENVAGLFDFSNYDLTSWITHPAMVHRPPGARQRFAVRLLSAHRRQQHPERRRVDPFRDYRRRILSQRLAARAGTLQLGAVCRMVTQPGGAAEQPERRFYLCDKLQPEGLYHQPGRKTNQKGIRLRDPCDPELEPGGSRL